jgi:Universal stress protein family
MLRGLLVVFDGSSHARRALAEARDLAQATAGRLTVMTVVPEPSTWALSSGYGAAVNLDELTAESEREYQTMLDGAVDTVPIYLRADISGEAGDDSTISSATLWWPPNKIAARFLAPYLSSQVGDAADVMPLDHDAIPLPRVPRGPSASCLTSRGAETLGWPRRGRTAMAPPGRRRVVSGSASGTAS